jgi:histidyl-tRNA synthetase
LVELLGGPATPANGWAAGIERILLAIGAEEDERRHDVFVAADDSQRERALALATELRRAGLRADIDLAGRSMKGQMRQADRVGAGHTLILDADGSARLRDMRSGEQREVDASRVVEELSTG